MRPLLQRWNKIRDGAFVFLVPIEYLGKGGKPRKAEPGDPVPKTLFKGYTLLGMYKNRKIAPPAETVSVV